jgi:hypothetical protein
MSETVAMQLFVAAYDPPLLPARSQMCSAAHVLGRTCARPHMCSARSRCNYPLPLTDPLTLSA